MARHGDAVYFESGTIAVQQAGARPFAGPGRRPSRPSALAELGQDVELESGTAATSSVEAGSKAARRGWTPSTQTRASDSSSSTEKPSGRAEEEGTTGTQEPP